MRKLQRVLALCTVAAVLSSGAAFAQDHHDQRDNHHFVQHKEWRKGYHMRHEDWARGERVDYRTYHLRRPPVGYEWRLIDGNYVLGAISTGVVFSVVVAR